MPRPSWLSNPWARNPWFETVAVAQSRAKKRLPWSVYGALVAGSERGVSANDNTAAFAELGFAPHIAGQKPEAPHGHHRDGPADLAARGHLPDRRAGRAPRGRGRRRPGRRRPRHGDGPVQLRQQVRSRRSSRPTRNTFFQMYWTGDRDVMIQRMERARAAGAKGLIATLDWSFSHGPRLGQPGDPGEGRPQDDGPDRARRWSTRPRWLCEFARTGSIPDLTAPNLAPPGEHGPDLLRRLLRVDDHPATHLGGRRVDARAVGRPVHAQGRLPRRRRQRAVDAGVTAISVSNHGGNNLDGTPGADPDAAAHRRRRRRPGRGRPRRRHPPRLATSSRPSPSAPGRCMIGRAYLWGLAANGQAGVENVLDILRGGIDSAMRGLGSPRSTSSPPTTS